jgi:hypothetical protein
MPTDSSNPSAPALPPATREQLLTHHQRQTVPRLERLWQYYRNALRQPTPTGSSQPYEPAQTQGLPDRLRTGSGALHGTARREQVIENDIAWRVHTLVDFMFGRSITLQSQAPDPDRARRIEQFLHAALDQAGGVSFFQDLALLGAVYGFVDVLVRGPARSPRSGAGSTAEADPVSLARYFKLEPVEAPRVVPVINEADYRQLDAYMIHLRRPGMPAGASHLLQRVRQRVLGGGLPSGGTSEHTEVWTAEDYERYRMQRTGFGQQRQRVAQGRHKLGRLPVVHIQNLPQPYFYEGLSEVEPLIPLQDELNTRLSDRANRVTFQSFKMYLGKGIDGFTERPVGPGQMWATDNPDASIQEFGGDGDNPSEDAHIKEIRQAMDKTSAVPPVAAGLVEGKLGNLTSESALRVTLMGLLARTEKKRITYGQGIHRLCELLLHAADVHGVFPNKPEERSVRIDWPDPIPESESSQLRNAQRKLELGVPRQQVLTELGYPEAI